MVCRHADSWHYDMLSCMSDESILTNDGTAPEPEGYDAWLRREVELGLRDADDQDAVWFTPEEVEHEMAELRSERDVSLLKKAS